MMNVYDVFNTACYTREIVIHLLQRNLPQINACKYKWCQLLGWSGGRIDIQKELEITCTACSSGPQQQTC